MVCPTLGSRMAEEQNSTRLPIFTKSAGWRRSMSQTCVVWINCVSQRQRVCDAAASRSERCVLCGCADLSVVVKLVIGNDQTPLGYAHTFSLLSPTFTRRRRATESCLSIDFMSQAEFVVRLVCLADRKVDDRVLRRSAVPLGFQLNRINLLVAGRDADADETCRFIFDIMTTESGTLAAIGSVTMTEAACQYEGLSSLRLPNYTRCPV